MSPDSDERKVKSNDIVNGVARRDIFDSNGVLQVKKGMRISSGHYDRMRDDGKIQEDKAGANRKAAQGDINYVSADSFHARLDKLVQRYRLLQKQLLLNMPFSEQEQQFVDRLIEQLVSMTEEKPHQILGELYLCDQRYSDFHRPVYAAAQVILLVQRFNSLKVEEAILYSELKQLILAALFFDIGLLQPISDEGPDTDLKLYREEFRNRSHSMLKSTGLDADLACQWILQSRFLKNASQAAKLLQTCADYAQLAFPAHQQGFTNASKVLASRLKSGEVDTGLASLLLKINGLSPIGSILQGSSGERYVVVRGPEPDDIKSSWIRLLTNRNGVQLKRPGERKRIGALDLKMVDHHQFAWSAFGHYVMWER